MLWPIGDIVEAYKLIIWSSNFIKTFDQRRFYDPYLTMFNKWDEDQWHFTKLIKREGNFLPIKVHKNADLSKAVNLSRQLTNGGADQGDALRTVEVRKILG